MKIFFTFFQLFFIINAFSQSPIDQFLKPDYMKGASISIMVKDVLNDTVIYSYDAERELIPASVMKIVTSASALEILGEQFRFETSIMYDGLIKDSILFGNLYIRGSGDPTLGSREARSDPEIIVREWIKHIKLAGIRSVTGAVISDESIFDLQGISMKMLHEDMGSYYGQGSYGINFMDNRYTLFLRTGKPNTIPEIIKTDPDLPFVIFNNYLSTNVSDVDSMYITGYPYSNERYLFGTVPANRFSYQQKGDIPDPPLFLSQFFTKHLEKDTVIVSGAPTCYRILFQNNNWNIQERKILFNTYSIRLNELVRITNYLSHNFYTDALLKTIGLYYDTDEELSSFEKGVKFIKKYWSEKGFNTSSIWMFDGSGLSTTDKLTASFICEFLSYMYTQSPVSKSFIESLPRAGVEGTVANFLRGSVLQGKARLKSGSMSRVRSYAGYVIKDGNIYSIAILVNNFSCSQTQMRINIEQLLFSFF